MADNLFLPDCGCDEVVSPAFEDVSESCPLPLVESEVKRLFLSHVVPAGTHVSPADWTLLADWTAVIDNSNTTGTKVKWLRGKGSVASTPGAEIIRSGHVKTTLEDTNTLTFTVDSISPEIYSFLQAIKNCPSLFYIWIETVGGFLFGAPLGIKVSSKVIPFKLDEGVDAYETYQIILEWKANTFPLRIVSPFA